MSIEELQEKQGWTAETLGKLAIAWIRDNGHGTTFEAHLTEVAANENVLYDADEDMDAEDEGDIEDE